MIFSELTWACFHLSLFHTVTMPILPSHTRATSLTCSKVQAIEIGLMTAVVPPSSFVARSTIATIAIIVVILGRKLHLIVISKGITGITLERTLVSL